MKIESGCWCLDCRKEYNNKYHKSKIGNLSLKNSQSKYQKTEKGKEAQKYANQRYLKKQNKIIGAIMSGNIDEFKIFIEEQIMIGEKKDGIRRAGLYFKTIKLWQDTLVEVGRVRGSFNGIWKNKNYKDVKEYYTDGGTYDEFVDLCDWLKAPEDEMGADRKTKRILKFISGLIKQSNNASSFRMEKIRLKELDDKLIIKRETIKRRGEMARQKERDKLARGFNG